MKFGFRVFSKLRRPLWPVAIAIAMVCFVFTACTNGELSNLLSQASALNGSSSTPAVPLTITTVLRDTQNPTGLFDVIGDASGSINTICNAAGSGSTTACQCQFTYDMPSPSNPNDLIPESIDVNTTYVEANMLRCPISAIPSSVTQVSVSVLVDKYNTTSNALTFTLIGGGSVLDTTLISNYSLVNRYTCKDVVNVPNLMDTTSGIYDPIQSENPANSYPLDFYSTNLGATLAAYAGSTGTPVTDWDCPANPLNPPSDYQVVIFSESPLGGTNGSEVIAGGTAADTSVSGFTGVPMNTPNARSTFYLANQPTSVFTQAVDAYIAPTLVSSSTISSGGGGNPVLGFGASPISTSSDGTERCPDSTVPIPSGYQWVKVWLFRMALPSREVLSSPNLQQLGNIGCNMGPYPISPGATNLPDNWTLPDCYQSNFVTPGGTAVDGNQTDTPSINGYSTTLATRFSEATGLCYRVKAGDYVSDNDGTPVGTINGDPVDSRTDEWIPNDEDTLQYGCGEPSQSPIDDQLHSCPSGSGPNGLDNDNLSELSSPPSYVTYDDSPSIINLDQNEVRYEFLFVVTPTTVNTIDMSNPASTVGQQYTPYRFQLQTKCNNVSPSTNCTADFQYAFRNYGLKLHDVTSNGDPPPSDPNSAPVFPVCALQPIGLPQ